VVRILLAGEDDVPSVRRWFLWLFENSHFEIQCAATDLKNTIQQSAEVQPDVLLISSANSQEVFRIADEIVARSPGLPMLLCTMPDNEESVPQALNRANCVLVLRTPSNIGKVLKGIERLRAEHSSFIN
jgi:DNA-binding NarL/FixJ family response regulator